MPTNESRRWADGTYASSKGRRRAPEKKVIINIPREEIDKATNDYLKAGGKITVVDEIESAESKFNPFSYGADYFLMENDYRWQI